MEKKETINVCKKVLIAIVATVAIFWAVPMILLAMEVIAHRMMPENVDLPFTLSRLGLNGIEENTPGLFTAYIIALHVVIASVIYMLARKCQGKIERIATWAVFAVGLCVLAPSSIKILKETKKALIAKLELCFNKLLFPVEIWDKIRLPKWCIAFKAKLCACQQSTKKTFRCRTCKLNILRNCCKCNSCHALRRNILWQGRFNLITHFCNPIAQRYCFFLLILWRIVLIATLSLIVLVLVVFHVHVRSPKKVLRLSNKALLQHLLLL